MMTDKKKIQKSAEKIRKEAGKNEEDKKEN